MSAYIVNPQEVLLLSARYLMIGKEDEVLDPACVNDLANELFLENYKSVNYHYNENANPAHIKSSLNHILDLVMTNSDAQVLKCCHHLDYQSCEPPGWESSDACGYLEAIVKNLENKGITASTKDYETAKWGI
jgi:hypothetical protein